MEGIVRFFYDLIEERPDLVDLFESKASLIAELRSPLTFADRRRLRHAVKLTARLIKQEPKLIVPGV